MQFTSHKSYTSYTSYISCTSNKRNTSKANIASKTSISVSRLSSYFLKNSVYLLYLASIDIKTPLSFPRYGFGMETPFNSRHTLYDLHSCFNRHSRDTINIRFAGDGNSV